MADSVPEIADIPAIPVPQWVERRCPDCNKLLGKITAYPTQDGIPKDSVKIGLDDWCRRCKKNVYKIYVV